MQAFELNWSIKILVGMYQQAQDFSVQECELNWSVTTLDKVDFLSWNNSKVDIFYSRLFHASIGAIGMLGPLIRLTFLVGTISNYGRHLSTSTKSSHVGMRAQLEC